MFLAAEGCGVFGRDFGEFRAAIFSHVELLIHFTVSFSKFGNCRFLISRLILRGPDFLSYLSVMFFGLDESSLSPIGLVACASALSFLRSLVGLRRIVITCI